MINKAIALMKTQDTYAAIEHMLTVGDATTVLENFSELVRYLYWQEKDVPAVVAMARAAIQYGIMQGQPHQLALAKGIAYNLASYTWLGWDEVGIKLNQADMLVGLDAAKVCVRLVKKLEQGDMPCSRAHWILGAQYLALKNIDQAKYHFYRAAVYAHRAAEEDEALLAWAFISITKRDPVQLQDIVTRLQARESGRPFLQQIETAKRIFWQTHPTPEPHP